MRPPTAAFGPDEPPRLPDEDQEGVEGVDAPELLLPQDVWPPVDEGAGAAGAAARAGGVHEGAAGLAGAALEVRPDGADPQDCPPLGRAGADEAEPGRFPHDVALATGGRDITEAARAHFDCLVLMEVENAAATAKKTATRISLSRLDIFF